MSGRGKSSRSLALIDAAKTILEEIQPASVRAVAYRLFALQIIMSMSKSETNRASVQLRDAREVGMIPWSWIVDETREPERVSMWRDPADYAETVKRSYRKDRWADQTARLEIWSEKATIGGTVRPVLDTYGVTFRVMHGYGSATAIHQAALESVASSKLLTVFYLGDFDPSGMHMSEIDLPERLDKYGGRVDLQRLALDEHDVADGTLPSFDVETKRADPRYRWFRDRYGSRCWELDALSPVLLRERVEQAIVRRLDMAVWQRAETAEKAELDSLRTILSRWPTISRQAQKCRGTAR